MSDQGNVSVSGNVSIQNCRYLPKSILCSFMISLSSRDH